MNNNCPYHHETQQTRQQKRLPMQEGCEIHAIGEKEIDQNSESISTLQVRCAVEDMLCLVEMQNKTFDRRGSEKSTLCVLC